MTTTTRRIFRVLATLAIIGIGALATLVGFLWVEHRTEVTLPAPSGPFVVGRSVYDWVDDKPDALAPVAGTKRELLVWIWYPARATQGQPAGDYLPAELRTPPAAQRGSSIWTLLTRDATNVHSHSHRDAVVSSRERSYPVVIFRAGASASVLDYSTLIEDLASHGYVVAGFDAPYRTGRVVFPDGRVRMRTPENNPEVATGTEFERRAKTLMDGWTNDMSFVLDRLAQLNAGDPSGKFTNRLDMTRVGVFGHSFGGAQAAQFCHDDPRCKAGIDIDGAPFGGVIQTGIDRPFMFILGDHRGESQRSSVLANIQAIYDRLAVNARARVEIRGANHFMFSDDGAVMKSAVVRGVLRLFGKLRIDARRQLEVTAYCIHTFFDAELEGRTGSKLNLSSPRYPEIQMLE